MYKPGYSRGVLLSVICTALLITLGCGGGEKNKESEETAHAGNESTSHGGHAPVSTHKSKKETIKGKRIGGQIRQDTTLSLQESPYILTRDLEILPDVKLAIEPGVVVKVAAYSGIIVRGNFHAIGEKDKPIKFTSLKKGSKWDGIQLKDESFDYDSEDLIEGFGCIIKYCEIENAVIGISCEKTSPVLSNNIIKNGEEGIKCYNEASPLITKNLIKDNLNGIVCIDFSSPEIKYNTVIGDEGKGIVCVNHSSPLIEYNTVFGAGSTWWSGIMCQNGAAPKIRHNNIYSNGGQNIKQVQKPGEESLAINAKNNWWGTDDEKIIANTIYDKNDRDNLGEVNYLPFVKTKIKDANHL